MVERKERSAQATAAGAEPYSLTMEAAARYTGFSRTRLEQALREGHVSAVKAGRRTLVIASTLREYVASLPPARN
jgi:excisionase family DNA binding protein